MSNAHEREINTIEAVDNVTVDLPDGRRLRFARSFYTRANGKKFFSRSEVEAIGSLLDETKTGWHLPTLEELQLAFAWIQYTLSDLLPEGHAPGMSGWEILDFLGIEPEKGEEYICGSSRAFMPGDSVYIWCAGQGYCKLTEKGVSFCREDEDFYSPVSVEDDIGSSSGFDHGRCLLAVLVE